MYEDASKARKGQTSEDPSASSPNASAAEGEEKVVDADYEVVDDDKKKDGKK